MNRTIVVLLLCAGCADGPRVDRCVGAARAVAAVELAAEEWGTRDDVDVLCRARTKPLCLRDVAGCVPWCGTDWQRGRIVVRDGEDVGAVVLHEQMHCSLPGDGCRDHGACWDTDELERAVGLLSAVMP